MKFDPSVLRECQRRLRKAEGQLDIVRDCGERVRAVEAQKALDEVNRVRAMLELVRDLSETE